MSIDENNNPIQLPQINHHFAKELEFYKLKKLDKHLRRRQFEEMQTHTEPPLTNEDRADYIRLYNSTETRNDIDRLERDYNNPIYENHDFQKTRYSDPASFNIFFNKLHKDNEIFRKGANTLSTPSFNFVRNTIKYRIVPNPIGVVKRKGDISKVELNNKRVGDSYIQCLTNSLSVAEHISELDLSKNRLSDISFIPLFNTIITNKILLGKLVSLNISYNKMGFTGAEILNKYLNDPLCSLETLNLEGLNLGNTNMRNIINAITNSIYAKLKYLNIGQNNIGDDIAQNLSTLINKCYNLDVLILYQNQFNNYGAGLIMSEIKKHPKIKILDLSWNSIGDNLNEEIPSLIELQKSNPGKKFKNAYLYELQLTGNYRKAGNLAPVKKNVSYFTNQLCDLFHNKKTQMLHLDISYNNIGIIDSTAISEHIKDNHTILGIHVDGNDMRVDELGFVFPVDKNEYKEDHFANSQIFYRIGHDHPLIKTNILNVQKLRGKNNCWICEGWKEVKFQYKPHINEGNMSSSVVKLYLSFEGFKPFDTTYKREGFVCYRMCPPGILNYYLTLNDIPVDNYGSNKTTELKEAIIHTQSINEDDDDDDDENDRELKQFIITKLGETKVEINPDVISYPDYIKQFKNCIPRPPKIKKIKKRPRTPWTFPISIWAYYRYRYEGETDDLIYDAFEFDYARGQYSKDKDLTDEQEVELKKILRSHWKKILDTYKNLSAYLGWKVWQIGQNQITEFASNCPNLLDSKYLINDVLVKVTEVKSNLLDKEERKRNPNVPDNIIRHQFMMLLVKVAKDKYFRTKQMSSITEALEYSFKNHYDSYLNQFDNHKWRMERYYNEFTDNVLKAYIPIFDAVFYSNAPIKKIGNKDSHWMWLEEFTNICTALMDADFPVKDIPVIFNLSMRTKVNEIDSEMHYNMQFPEFLEAIARFAEKLSPIPPGEDKLAWNMKMRQEQDLYVKIESLIPGLTKLIKGDYRYVKDKFPMPQRDEDGYLIVDYESPFYKGKLPMPRKKRKRTTRIVPAN